MRFKREKGARRYGAHFLANREVAVHFSGRAHPFLALLSVVSRVTSSQKRRGAERSCRRMHLKRTSKAFRLARARNRITAGGERGALYIMWA